MIRAKRWKVIKIGPEAWLFHHSNCPPKRHLCFRGMLSGTLCGVRASQPAAFTAANSRHAFEAHELWRVMEELAPPLGWDGNVRGTGHNQVS